MNRSVLFILQYIIKWVHLKLTENKWKYMNHKYARMNCKMIGQLIDNNIK